MAFPRRACSNALRASCRAAVPTVSRRSFAVAAAAAAAVSRSSTPAASARRIAVVAPRFYSSDSEYHEISATGSKLWNFEQMKELAKDPKGVVIVDAREPHELVETGRIPSAINIPVATAPESFFIAEEDFEDRYGYPRPSKDTEIVFYCKAGVRSKAFATIAREAGWKNVGEYPGSWLDWKKNGGEVEPK
ncbi:rhodanese-like domain-containing protein [Colletotrichum karsti]|uniref:Rhodanese-like domain-containing protein n=1 Tax=Colletotrichum karsti TaxID=1095194 RepID=A0A9P6IFB7_9PEZI|nr:rhodanese-like domain-containing protein [Colletotrichum karsti]KAF9881362.1 rhodanese-like domain-containing protein [Colletotrichum karsti]